MRNMRIPGYVETDFISAGVTKPSPFMSSALKAASRELGTACKVHTVFSPIPSSNSRLI